jgi:hypothetical protein
LDTRGGDPISAHDPYVVCDLLLLSDTKPTQSGIFETKVASTGAGNIRSAYRDAIRAENGNPDIRSELLGRGYDRDLISAIDNVHNTGVVRQI